MQIKRVLSSKITIGALLVLLAIFTNLKFRQWQQQQEVEKLKASLMQQEDSIQKKNQDLSTSINYLNSEDFKEQVARQQLNLKKEGEIVYTFTQNNVAATTTNFAAATKPIPNQGKWWNYFFGKN